MRSLLLKPPILLAIALLIAGAVVGMSSILAWVITTWYSFFGVGVYSHGYLVFGLALWIGWTQWRRDPPQHLGPFWWGLVPLAVLVAGMAAMELMYIDSSRALLLPPLFVAATLLVFGRSAAFKVVVPAGFVYFGLLPFWALNPPLQALATAAVSVLMGFGDLPFLIEEFYVHIPAGTFEIATGCSGLSFLLSALTLAIFYSAMYLRRWMSRLTLIAAAAVAALVSNWIRIWTLILIGERTALQHWLIDDHYLYGWVLFIIGLVPVLFLARYLEVRELAKRNYREDARTSEESVPTLARTRTMLMAAVAGAVILSAPRFFAIEAAPVVAQPPLPLPDLDHYGAVQIGEPEAWHPNFRNARQGSSSYDFKGKRIDVFMAFYPRQDRDHHLFLRRNTFLDERWRTSHSARHESDRNALLVDPWRTGRTAQREVTVNGETVMVNEFLGTQAGRERLIWSWYEVAGRPVTSRLGAKLAEMAALPSGHNDGFVIAVATDCAAGCDPARERMEAFLETAGGAMRAVP